MPSKHGHWGGSPDHSGSCRSNSRREVLKAGLFLVELAEARQMRFAVDCVLVSYLTPLDRPWPGEKCKQVLNKQGRQGLADNTANSSSQRIIS